MRRTCGNPKVSDCSDANIVGIHVLLCPLLGGGQELLLVLLQDLSSVH